MTTKKRSARTMPLDAFRDKIVEAIANSEAPWQKPWTPGTDVGVPHNLITGRKYKGASNLITLFLQAMWSGYPTQGWLTFRQAKEAGTSVMKGETGTMIGFWRPVVKEVVNPTTGLKEEKVHFVHKSFTVFNESQLKDPLTDAVRPPEMEAQPEPVQFVVKLYEALGVKINWGGNAAFYQPSTDSVTLPQPKQFVSENELSATALHELVHATMHETRLKRKVEDRAREELVAETGAWLAAMTFGLPFAPNNTAAYLKTWASRLQGDDTKEIDKALADANRAINLLIKTAKNAGLIVDEDCEPKAESKAA